MLMHFTFINPTESLQAAVEGNAGDIVSTICHIDASFSCVLSFARIAVQDKASDTGAQTMEDGTFRPVVIDQHHGALIADYRIV